MIHGIRVVKVPKAGYLVIGDRTYHLGDKIKFDASNLDPDEVRNLVKEDYIEFFGESSQPGEKKRAK